MDSIGKALWFIESHLAEDIALADVAAVAGLSRFHLVRAFGDATGHSVMRYVRGRRLTGAARALADGAPDILAVALDAGYGSHEAFTRAFRDQFGLTPEAVRTQRHTDNLKLVEPITMTTQPLADLDPPRFIDGRPMLMVGLLERFDYERRPGIPALWQRFVPWLGHLPGEVGGVTWGLMRNADDAAFDYMACVEVRDFSGLAAGLTRIRVEAQRYAVFAHHGHVSTLVTTFAAIWRQWLPESGLVPAEAPQFERYGPAFDQMTGMGDIEVWIPIER